MSKWLALGAVALLLAWGPFLSAELTSEPAEKKARDLPSEVADSDEPVEFFEDEPEQEPEELPAPEAEAVDEGQLAAAQAELHEPELSEEVLAQHREQMAAAHAQDEGEVEPAEPPATPPATCGSSSTRCERA
jgi:hypothetical protein